MVDIVRVYTANMTNITSPENFLSVMNTNLNNSIGIFILLAVFFVMFLTLMRADGTFKNAFAASSFVCTLLAWLLWILNWVGNIVLITFFLMLIVSVCILYANRE